jgi:hypothetical protein
MTPPTIAPVLVEEACVGIADEVTTDPGERTVVRVVIVV